MNESTRHNHHILCTGNVTVFIKTMEPRCEGSGFVKIYNKFFQAHILACFNYIARKNGTMGSSWPCRISAESTDDLQ
jgi:hypothetical protein